MGVAPWSLLWVAQQEWPMEDGRCGGVLLAEVAEVWAQGGLQHGPHRWNVTLTACLHGGEQGELRGERHARCKSGPCPYGCGSGQEL